MILDKVIFYPLVLGAVFLSACTDYVQQIEDDYEHVVWNQKADDCVPSAKPKKESREEYYEDDYGYDVRRFYSVIRDFQPNHPDFENFSEESVNHINDIYNYRTSTGAAMNLFGYDATWYADAAYHNTCGNANTFGKFGVGAQIGTDGLPMQVNPYLPAYLQGVSRTNKVLSYGECSQKSYMNRVQRGYKNAQDDVVGFKCPNGSTEWANPVIYTPGMVFPYLNFTQVKSNGTPDMLEGVIISKMNERCDNQFFAQWFADVPGVNKRINTTLDIPRDLSSWYYVYDYNYNNGGFFPLDSINPLTGEWVMNKPCNASIQPKGFCDQYEPQTLSIFCPPYNYQYAKNQLDDKGQNTYSLCTEWLNQGGPRATNSSGSGHSAAWQAAVMYDAMHTGSRLGMRHLRNYGFTMMSYASFKYKSSNQVPSHERIDVVSDGDMWIFVDGILVVDLGGTHLPAPGKVDVEVLARNNHGCHTGEPLATYTNCSGASDLTGWADDTWHHLHIFYANRQSDGSNLYIRSSIAEQIARLSNDDDAQDNTQEDQFGCESD